MSAAISIKRKIFHPLVVVITTLICCLSVLILAIQGPLDGNFNFFFMPAEKFGIPSELQAHGITVQYKGPIETGWDGQFYYYISNDVFAKKDTLQHIDSNAYRYQRIGLPLFAKIISKLSGQHWVSPFTYYGTNLLLIILAAGFAAFFFQARGYSPYWVLLWALGCGTQLTLLHGLPDSAADAFLIIALISLMSQRHFIYLAAITFAALSREVYVLVPIFITLGVIIDSLRTKGVFFLFKPSNFVNFIKQSWIHILPTMIMIGWQIYLRVRFNVSPSTQAGDVLGPPFINIFYFMLSGFQGKHPIMGAGWPAYEESIGIILFILLLGLSAAYLFRSLIRSIKLSSTDNPIYFGISSAFLILIGMYVCFGPIVMMRYSGYFKASNIFIFLIPFLACINDWKMNKVSIAFLIVISLFFDKFLWDRINSAAYHAADKIQYTTSEPTCLKSYSASVAPVSIEQTPTTSFVKSLFLRQSTVINVKVTNTSSEPFSPYQGKGAVNVSYQWLKASDNSVVKDGNRSQLPTTLAPNQATVVPIYVAFPHRPGEYLLKLSLVQEGCSWFYLANPKSAFTIPYRIKL